MEYERPELEEIELEIEGSFLQTISKDPEEEGGDEWD